MKFKLSLINASIAALLFVSGCRSSSDSSASNEILRAESRANASLSNNASNLTSDSYSNNASNSSGNSTAPTANRSTPPHAGNLTVPTAVNSTAPSASPAAADSTPMSEEEKYKVFYAASESGDGTLVLKVSRKLGLNYANDKPTPAYIGFLNGYVTWTSKDKAFPKTINTKKKAADYVNSHLKLD